MDGPARGRWSWPWPSRRVSMRPTLLGRRYDKKPRLNLRSPPARADIFVGPSDATDFHRLQSRWPILISVDFRAEIWAFCKAVR